MANITKKNWESNRPMMRDFFNVGSFFDDSWLSRFENKFPAVNISENERQYEIDLVVPGFKKEDIKIKVDDNMLTVSAETKTESKEEDKREFTRREYNYSSFTRSFHLPDNAKDDNIDAHYEDGVLTIKIPKTEMQVKATKEVPVN
jgi:HSP20 family protein